MGELGEGDTNIEQVVPQQEKPSYLSSQSWSEKDPDFNAPYPITILPAEILGPVDVINRIFSSEISAGERSDTHDPGIKPDSFDTLHAKFNTVLTQQAEAVGLTKAQLADIKMRYVQYADRKGLTEEQRAKDEAELARLTSLLEQAVRARWDPAPKPPMPDNYVPVWLRDKVKRTNDKLKKM